MRFLLALALFLAMAGPASAPALGQESAAQRAQEEAEARSFAVQLSRLEAAGQYHQLYELMHPDAKAVVSEAAVVGWYEENMGPRGPAPIQVSQVLSVPWIWQVTGRPYFDAVAVSYIQPFADGSSDAGTVHLAKDARGAWGWFFGGSAEFVRSQEERHAPQSSGRDQAPPPTPTPKRTVRPTWTPTPRPTAAVPTPDPRVAPLQTQVSEVAAMLRAEQDENVVLATQVSELGTRVAEVTDSLNGQLDRNEALAAENAVLSTQVAVLQLATESPVATHTPTPTPTPRVIQPAEPTWTPTPKPTPRPTFTPTVVPTPAPVHKFVDPRLLESDPASYVGQRVWIQGRANTVQQGDDYTWVSVGALPADSTASAVSMIAIIRPPVRDLLSDECFRFLGIFAGTDTAVIVISGQKVEEPLLEVTAYRELPGEKFGLCDHPYGADLDEP